MQYAKILISDDVSVVRVLCACMHETVQQLSALPKSLVSILTC